LVLRGLPLTALLVFVAGLALGPMAESDLFFRIKAGQEILARHGLPGVNLYSFTYPDFPDLDASWLFEVAVALIHGRAGFPGVVVVKTAVLLATFAVAYVVCRRRGAGPVAAVAALAAAALVARERFVERPHVVSFAGEIALLAAVDALVVAGARRAAVVVVALTAGVVLWANLHAGVFVAPLILAAGGLGAAVSRDRAAAGRLAIAAALAALATLATPLGAGLFTYLRLHLALTAVHPIDEFRAPTLVSDAPLLAFGAVMIATAAAARVRPGWMRIAPAVALAALTLRSVRFAADFALVAAPLLAVSLTALGRGPRLSLRARGWLAGPAPAVAAIGFLMGAALIPRAVAAEPWNIGLDTRELPLSAIAFADTNGLRQRMYNDFETGSYLLYDPAGGYPRHRVFVDPRIPAYPIELHRLLGRNDLTRAEWTAEMQRFGVDAALLAYAGVNRRVAWWDPEVWALVFRADDARVFVRRSTRHEALIAAREIPATFAFSVEEGAATVPLDTRPARSPVRDCEWNRRLGDLRYELLGKPSASALDAYHRALAAPAGCLDAGEEARLCSWLGALALGSGRGAEALELFDRALARGAPRDATALSNRALALEAAGRTREAASGWKEVEAAAPNTPLGTRAADRRRALEAVTAPFGATPRSSP